MLPRIDWITFRSFGSLNTLHNRAYMHGYTTEWSRGICRFELGHHLVAHVQQLLPLPFLGGQLLLQLCKSALVLLLSWQTRAGKLVQHTRAQASIPVFFPAHLDSEKLAVFPSKLLQPPLGFPILALQLSKTLVPRNSLGQQLFTVL